MRTIFFIALGVLTLLCVALAWSLVVDASDLTRLLGMDVVRQEAWVVIVAGIFIASVAALWSYVVIRGRRENDSTAA